MAIFTPPDIGGGLRDFVDYMRADRPHRWPALGVAVAVPAVVFYFMARAIHPAEAPKGQIIYVESWRADRSDYDVRRDWLARARAANERNRRRRDAYGAFARTLGQDYDVRRADDEFGAALADIDAAEREVDAAEREARPIRDLTRDRAAAATAAPAANR